ncbi:MAG: helix-turn-helix domain-containing protein [Paludibacter sp.]|jgi:transcriptional regulator with XRE-family HTH domain
MDIRFKIGQRIKQLRTEKNVSQNDLAYFSGLDRSYLAGVENGKRNITIVNLEKIITALEITVKKFYDDTIFEEQKEIK